MITKIKINGEDFTPEELGLSRIEYGGKRYLDVTPFWIDSKESQRIHKIIAEKTPKQQ